MKDVSKTLSIAGVVAMVSAAGVTIAQTTDSVPNSNSPNAASSPYETPSTDKLPSTTALPTNEGTMSQSDSGTSAAPASPATDSSTPAAGSMSSTDSQPTSGPSRWRPAASASSCTRPCRAR